MPSYLSSTNTTSLENVGPMCDDTKGMTGIKENILTERETHGHAGRRAGLGYAELAAVVILVLERSEA